MELKSIDDECDYRCKHSVKQDIYIFIIFIIFKNNNFEK